MGLPDKNQAFAMKLNIRKLMSLMISSNPEYNKDNIGSFIVNLWILALLILKKVIFSLHECSP